DSPAADQARELVGLPAQLPGAAQLRLDEPERRARPRVVALAAFGAAREMPGLLAYPPGGLRVLHRQLDIFAQRPDKRRVGLIVVPAVRIALPVAAVEVEDLRLQLAGAGRVAMFHVEAERPGQDAVL